MGVPPAQRDIATEHFFVVQIGPRGSTAEVTPAGIDSTVASRYRFYAAADGPGRACGPANINMFVSDTPAGAASGCSAASAASVGLPIFLPCVIVAHSNLLGRSEIHLIGCSGICGGHFTSAGVGTIRRQYCICMLLCRAVFYTQQLAACINNLHSRAIWTFMRTGLLLRARIHSWKTACQ